MMMKPIDGIVRLFVDRGRTGSPHEPAVIQRLRVVPSTRTHTTSTTTSTRLCCDRSRLIGLNRAIFVVLSYSSMALVAQPRYSKGPRGTSRIGCIVVGIVVFQFERLDGNIFGSVPFITTTDLRRTPRSRVSLAGLLDATRCRSWRVHRHRLQRSSALRLSAATTAMLGRKHSRDFSRLL